MKKIAVSVLIICLIFLICCSTAQKEDVKYVASKNREPFHKPTCKWAKKISSENLQKFKTREEAIAAGHRPCKVCKP